MNLNIKKFFRKLDSWFFSIFIEELKCYFTLRMQLDCDIK